MMKQYQYRQFTATRLYGTAAYSPDGSQIAYVDNVTGQHNLWVMPSGGGIPRQLTTFSDNTVRHMDWSPDGKVLAFSADQDGDENQQIYLVELAGSWPERITDNLERRYYITDWSPDGSTLLYTTNETNPGDMDTVTRNLKTGETKRLVTGALHFAGNFSPDGKYATVLKVYGNTNQDILVLEVESGETALATPHEGDIIFEPVDWSHDSKGFYFVTNTGREFTGLAYYTLETSKWEWVYTPDHDVEAAAINKDGSVLVTIFNDNGRSRLYGRNLKTGAEIKMPEMPLGVARNLSLAPDGTRAVFIFTGAREASNLFEFNLQTGKLIRLGQSMIGGINLDDLVEPELIEYESFDGRKIPAWLYRPKTGGDKFPVVLSIHGGPEAQERAQYNYNGLYQYLLNRGIAVLAPNIRGSTGYGISYQKLIHRDWGGAEMNDMRCAAEYLKSLNWIDSNRMAIFGGSFGGFATLTAMTRLAEYWTCGVDIVGPANLITFVKAVPDFWKPMMKKWIGDPEEDADFLRERSPITYVDNIRAPLLVIQGAKDPRVVQGESDQMVERIRANGGDVEYYVDENEGHGTTRRENSIKWMGMVAEYLENKLISN
jgi:dipeptidyl aminopeptidase/acylaminoacyl peptidase